MLNNDFIVPTSDAAADSAATEAAVRRARSERAKVFRSLFADLAGLFRRRPDPIARAIAELNALSDRELADLGIGRGDIAWVVRHGRPGFDEGDFASADPANDRGRPAAIRHVA